MHVTRGALPFTEALAEEFHAQPLTFINLHLNFHFLYCKKMVLRRIFGPKKDEVTGNGGDCITRSYMICIPHPILCG